jgi:AraC-like DNA-binding protein
VLFFCDCELQEYGVKFNTILQNIRMQYAYKIICKTVHNLSSIALILGYKHASGLSTHIKQWFGASLVEMRKNERLDRFSRTKKTHQK